MTASRLQVALLALLALPATSRAETVWDHFARVSEFMPRPTDLYLMLFDATGDGRDELFLAHSQKCGNGGCPWSVYSPTAPGVVAYLGELAMPARFFRFDRVSQTMVSCWHMSAGDCQLVRYRFRAGGIEQLPGATCDAGQAACERELQSLRRYQRLARIPLLATKYDPEQPELAWSGPDPIAPSRLPAISALTVR